MSFDSPEKTHRLIVCWRGDLSNRAQIDLLKKNVAEVAKQSFGDLRHQDLKADIKDGLLAISLSFVFVLDAIHAYENFEQDSEYWGDATRWNGFRFCGISYFSPCSTVWLRGLTFVDKQNGKKSFKIHPAQMAAIEQCGKIVDTRFTDTGSMFVTYETVQSAKVATEKLHGLCVDVKDDFGTFVRRLPSMGADYADGARKSREHERGSSNIGRSDLQMQVKIVNDNAPPRQDSKNDDQNYDEDDEETDSGKKEEKGEKGEQQEAILRELYGTEEKEQEKSQEHQQQQVQEQQNQQRQDQQQQQRRFLVRNDDRESRWSSQQQYQNSQHPMRGGYNRDSRSGHNRDDRRPYRREDDFYDRDTRISPNNYQQQRRAASPPRRAFSPARRAASPPPRRISPPPNALRRNVSRSPPRQRERPQTSAQRPISAESTFSEVVDWVHNLEIDELSKRTVTTLIEDEKISGNDFLQQIKTLEEFEKQFDVKILIKDRKTIREALQALPKI